MTTGSHARLDIFSWRIPRQLSDDWGVLYRQASHAPLAGRASSMYGRGSRPRVSDRALFTAVAVIHISRLGVFSPNTMTTTPDEDGDLSELMQIHFLEQQPD